MSKDLWSDGPPTKAELTANTASSVNHDWLARIGIGFITLISILVPLVFGLCFYLADTDGIVIDANDPLHETRLWMIQERAGVTGIGLTITSPQRHDGNEQCAATSVSFIKWDRSLRLETDASYCRCYKVINGQLVQSSTIACKP